MKKFAGLFVLLVLVAVPAVAQDAPSQGAPPQDSSSQSTSSSQTAPEAGQQSEKKPISTRFTPEYEISAGFDHRSFGPTGASRVGMNGWYGSFDYNWKRWLGFEGELQGVYTTQHPLQGGVERPSIYTAMAGPQIFPFGHHKLSPFGHFLYGEGYYRETIGPYSPFGSTVVTAFSQAWEAGGGLDYHIKPRWSIRGMFDYGSTHFSSSGTGGQSSYRLAVGMVHYFGEK
jgi:opacity protein-like surface antigen